MSVMTLRWFAAAMEVAKSMETAHGIKYAIDGGVETPGGKTGEEIKLVEERANR